VCEFGPLFRFSFVCAPVSMVTIVARKYQWGKTVTPEKTHTLGSIDTKQKVIFISTVAVLLWFLQLSIGCEYIISYLHAEVTYFLDTG
jgi:hypothetical protein